MSNDLMEKIISLCKRRGFVFPGSEIYGGLANSWDYGPLGVELKNNIKKLWWQMFVQERDDMVGLDAAIIMNPKVWEASGHVGGFSDPLVECKKCHARYRQDELIAGYMKENEIVSSSTDKILPHLSCPNCGNKEFTEAKQFNLMFKTFLGPASSEATAGKSSEEKVNEVFLRPETAQAMFVDFKNITDSTRLKLPFGIAQIGKAFRNEITPGNFIFRTREFEQMEVEYFVKPEEWQQYFDHWLGEMKKWIKAVGIDESKTEYTEIAPEDRAHYSQRTIDVEFDYPFGKKELYGLAYRADFDLKNHFKEAPYRDAESGEEFWPHVIEPSLGVDRTMLAVLLSCYDEVETRSGDDDSAHEKEIVLRLPKALAPIKVAILPLSKKVELSKPAKELAQKLRKYFICQYDETQSIGKRYRRQDEIGTPYCVTFDFDSLNDKKVTVRDRDTMAQDRIAIDELVSYLKEKIDA